MTEPVPEARFNPQARAQVLRLGREKTPLVVIESALLNPDSVRDQACGARFIAAQRTLYPGINAPVDKPTAAAIIKGVAPILTQIYGFQFSPQRSAMGYFGLVTTKPEALTRAQIIPHYDRTDPLALAILLYLCGPEHGGTGFYTHTATGFERITREREPAYNAALDTEAPLRKSPAAYFDETTQGFERIGKIEAHYNRIAIYPSNLLHTSLIDASRLSADPLIGRLTANIFVA